MTDIASPLGLGTWRGWLAANLFKAVATGHVFDLQPKAGLVGRARER